MSLKMFLRSKWMYYVGFSIFAASLIVYEFSETVQLYRSQKTISISEIKFNKTTDRPWYFQKNGTIRPRPGDRHDIWPNEAKGDRITNQLMYVPSGNISTIKYIHIANVKYMDQEIGRKQFVTCPVDACEVVTDREKADAVIFDKRIVDARNDVPSNQIWIVLALENPFFSNDVYNDNVNWTSGYRPDSDVVRPYSKWLYYDEEIKTKKQTKNYAKGKTKKVAWIVSNCNAVNNRMEYAQELKKYIDVDIYGKCGDAGAVCKEKNCKKELLTDYKFYLAFENANCRYYMTEKLYRNALLNNLIPIVMGAHPDDYDEMAPHRSYIHVDHFSSPKDLADYLHILDKNDDLYNSYFEWKGSGEFINFNYLCRVCALLHSNPPTKSYSDFKRWWNFPGNCIKGSWLQK